ncbi:right-handed parallel beta-helix repeat-containing protein [bacterium]|nr:right-handed parallel beta-helix repeat-containing protein [bacterium]
MKFFITSLFTLLTLASGQVWANTYCVNTAFDANAFIFVSDCNASCTPTDFGGGLTGYCPLRKAIDMANAHAGADEIIFNIAGLDKTINVVSNLPVITESLEIDGTSQPGFNPNLPPPVIITPADGVASVGLELQGTQSVVKGLQVLGFDDDGIRVGPEDDVTVANHVIGPYNVISGNGEGLRITSNFNVIIGNYIGTTADGTAAYPNDTGISLTNFASGNAIGGDFASDGNVISGSTKSGINISVFSHDNYIGNNFVGTDATGNAAIPNTEAGIKIHHGSYNNEVGPGNLISGNEVGIYITRGTFDFSVRDNVVFGNTIGLSSAGDVLGNTSHGILVDDGADHNFIGSADDTTLGDCTGSCNVISGNGGDGIYLVDVREIFMGYNSIYNNAGLGINIPNLIDNNAIPAPIIESISTSEAGDHTFVLNVNTGAVGEDYMVQVFENEACDASGFGEGQTLVLSQNFTADASGIISVNMPVTTTNGLFLSATITRVSTGDTSEFSNCQEVPAFVPATEAPAESGGSGSGDPADGSSSPGSSGGGCSLAVDGSSHNGIAILTLMMMTVILCKRGRLLNYRNNSENEVNKKSYSINATTPHWHYVKNGIKLILTRY